MLTALSIRDLVIIEALDLEFSGGLGVLTGETGAGKSILLDALGLALGARADSGLVRHGCARARVTATFAPLPADHPARSALDDAGVEIDAGEPLIVRRQVDASGGSKAFVNDQPVSAGLLREIGTDLVEIHGQHDDRGLLDRSGHRALLDSFGGLATRSVADAHAAMATAQAALSAARAALEADAADREWLDHAIEEIEAFAPEDGEEERLAGLRSDMQKGERLADELAELDRLLGGSEGGPAQLRGAARRLDRIAEDHPLLAEALAAIDRAVIEASEGEEALARAKEAMRFDPAELENAETRLFDLRALARKHRVEASGLADLLATLTARRDALDQGAISLKGLEDAAMGAVAAYRAVAGALSDARTEAATRLDARVASELAPLKLDAAKFRTAIDRLPEEAWGPAGIDRIAFEISTNPGAPFAPLIKIASGGELSRFILALKVALAEEGGADTIIFDEIDRGVGGAVASAIGDRLARLAQGKQLLAVTHSPQVAARGAHHLLIAKSHDGTVTRTGVTPLDAKARREEIARMLSGASVTDEARAQAERLLEVV
ncbi:DNA repair protein RecN [Sphingorhabdus soli]|uniref:DNA repair protein RecN n=1 Tax=Flavisphingopyxis soli TaxID=2601267 RepID=A0A5C6U606_9SPHN|nr:DNA repair protein RecN [Sphingorhabdus soli]TXC68287.1 DNA repair protein RecN [Sphingorhabdus soli]